MWEAVSFNQSPPVFLFCVQGFLVPVVAVTVCCLTVWLFLSNVWGFPGPVVRSCCCCCVQCCLSLSMLPAVCSRPQSCPSVYSIISYPVPSSPQHSPSFQHYFTSASCSVRRLLPPGPCPGFRLSGPAVCSGPCRLTCSVLV